MNINPFVYLLLDIVDLYSYVLVAWLIVSWLVAFNILNTHQIFVYKLNYALNRLTAPLLNPIRSILPDLGGLDISPILLFMLIKFIKSFIITYIIY